MNLKAKDYKASLTGKSNKMNHIEKFTSKDLL